MKASKGKKIERRLKSLGFEWKSWMKNDNNAAQVTIMRRAWQRNAC